MGSSWGHDRIIQVYKGRINSHVNVAVSHMDGSTQETASLVQHAVSTASALSAQARDLEQAVGAFKL